MKEFTEKLISRLEEESYDMEICEEQFDMNRPYFKDVPYKMLKLEDVKNNYQSTCRGISSRHKCREQSWMGSL